MSLTDSILAENIGGGESPTKQSNQPFWLTIHASEKKTTTL